MHKDIQQINRIIKTRRSVFNALYTDEEVDDHIIRQMLENANWAPTHKFTEPWRFTVFKGAGREKLGAFQADIYEQVTRADGTYQQKKHDNLRQKPLTASHVIAIGMKRDPEHQIDKVEEIAAVACAVQNMYLTATAYGVGCYWSTGGVTYFEEAKSFFGLEGEDELMGFMFVGMPKKWPVNGKREPVINKVTWVE